MVTSGPPASQDTQKSIIRYSESIFSLLQNNYNFRSRLLEADRIYAREMDWSETQRRAELANKTGDPTRTQNVQVPVVGPQVDSARSYFVDLFLNSYPLFPVVTGPDKVDVGLQLETILGNSAVFYQWSRHLAMNFLDGLKYNICAAEVEWQVESVPEVYTNPAQDARFGVTREKTFAGNKIKRIDPYNLIFDTRVPPTEVHTRGEFVGYSELITRIELKEFFLKQDRSMTMNATDAFQSGTSAVTVEGGQTATYYVPQVNPRVFNDPKFVGFNWLAWANLDTKNKIRYSDMYEKTVLYCRIIPREFGLTQRFGNKNPGDPQIYKFVIINRQVPIFVQRVTNAHGMLPIVIGQLNEDGLGLQTKSYGENAAPYQFLSTSLYNSALASQRRKVYDRIIYDPSRINKKDIDQIDPVARIPIKTEGYGKPIQEAIFQVPYRDEGVASILGMARDVVEMADISTGQNRVQRGQFQKGNKTRYEFDTVMQNSDARPRTSAILFGVQYLHPIKEMLKYNILQYQPPAELFNQQQQQPVKIDPVQLRQLAWDFQLADGQMPSDKMIDFELFGQMIQYSLGNPMAAAEYDLTGMFVYQLKLRGAKWVDQFKRDPAQQERFLQQAIAMQQKPAAPAA